MVCACASSFTAFHFVLKVRSDGVRIPGYVINHGILNTTTLMKLLKNAKVRLFHLLLAWRSEAGNITKNFIWYNCENSDNSDPLQSTAV